MLYLPRISDRILFQVDIHTIKINEINNCKIYSRVDYYFIYPLFYKIVFYQYISLIMKKIVQIF